MFHSVIHQKDPQDSISGCIFTEIYYSKGYKAKAAGKGYALMGSREVQHGLPMSFLVEGHTEYSLSHHQLWTSVESICPWKHV